jgi:hypothetical protein
MRDQIFVAERTLDQNNWSNLETEFLEYFRLKEE